jgi:hypothetical protein
VVCAVVVLIFLFPNEMIPANPPRTEWSSRADSRLSMSPRIEPDEHEKAEIEGWILGVL